jgi:arginine-tRNA-protein transferase
MYPATREQFEAFIKTKTIDTRFFMFYLENKLISVSVTDSLENGLSAVYTFFEPTEIKRSLGIFSILYQLQICHTLSLPYLFLGYWIKDCPKMQYKSNFRPIEMLIDGKWIIVK